MDDTVHHLQCISNSPASFPQEKLHMLQTELGKIIASTLNVMVHLVRKTHLKLFKLAGKHQLAALLFAYFIFI